MEERFSPYALSTIMHRALPDVRDGLKPVHRRIIPCHERDGPAAQFLVQEMRPASSATSSVSSTRMATSRSMMRWCAWRRTSPSRYPVVDARATSAISTAITLPPTVTPKRKMTEVAALLLEGIDQDAVDFRPTYNEEDQEPTVLPGAFPNLLANGASGIAVGNGRPPSPAQCA